MKLISIKHCEKKTEGQSRTPEIGTYRYLIKFKGLSAKQCGLIRPIPLAYLLSQDGLPRKRSKQCWYQIKQHQQEVVGHYYAFTMPQFRLVVGRFKHMHPQKTTDNQSYLLMFLYSPAYGADGWPHYQAAMSRCPLLKFGLIVLSWLIWTENRIEDNPEDD